MTFIRRMIDVTEAIVRSQDLSRSSRELGAQQRRPALGRRACSVIYSTLSLSSVKRLIRKNYNLDGPFECVLYHRGLSDTYLVKTPLKRFALRIYKSDRRSRDAILGELRAIERVQRFGATVALPISRRDGGAITSVSAPEGIRSAVLFEWASGRPPSYENAAQAARYGEAVATLHSASDGLPMDQNRPVIDMDCLLVRPVRCIVSRMADSPVIVRRLEELVSRISQDVKDAQSFAGDWGFCHGDVWSGNAMIEDTRLVLLDFDHCGWGWRISDLASYKYHARYCGVEKQAWQPFVDGYLRVRPVISGSLKYLGLFVLLSNLWMTAHTIKLCDEVGLTYASDECIEKLILDCEKIEAEAMQTA